MGYGEEFPKKGRWYRENMVKRREVESKGEKERYKLLNAEFQRITRRDKKAFSAKK